MPRIPLRDQSFETLSRRFDRLTRGTHRPRELDGVESEVLDFFDEVCCDLESRTTQLVGLILWYYSKFSDGIRFMDIRCFLPQYSWRTVIRTLRKGEADQLVRRVYTGYGNLRLIPTLELIVSLR